MAYANLISQSCINPIETFCRFRDFICKRNGTYDYSTTGIGWTLYDESYATSEDTPRTNDWFVIYSPGEDGLQDLYFKITLNINGFIVTGYLSWDTSTNAGTCAYGAQEWTNTSATNNILWIYGDLDQLIGIAKYAYHYYSMTFGWMPDSPIDQTITNYPSAISAGSSVTLTFASVPAAWVVGTKLFVWDATNIERVAITNVSGSDVTFSTSGGDAAGGFANSYGSGADFSLEKTYFAAHQSASSGIFLMIDHAGTKNAGCSIETVVYGPSSGESLTGLLPAKDTYFYSATMLGGPLKNSKTTLNLTSETTHTMGATNYRFFDLYSSKYTLIKEV